MQSNIYKVMNCFSLKFESLEFNNNTYQSRNNVELRMCKKKTKNNFILLKFLLGNCSKIILRNLRRIRPQTISVHSPIIV